MAQEIDRVGTMSSAMLSLQRAVLKVHMQWMHWTGRSGQTYFHHRVAEYREMWRAIADACGGSFTPLADDLWQVEVNGITTRVHNHEMEFDNPVVLRLAGCKTVVHRMLQSAGLPIPEYAVFSLADLDRAQTFLREHPAGCVVKPVNGYGGQGVTTHVQRPEELKRAALLASLYGRELIVERQVPGESYRLLVLEGETVHAVRRRGPRLRGDGSSTIRQLIEAENIVRRQTGDPVLDIDRDCEFTLRYQGLSLDAIPDTGRVVVAKSVNDPVRKYTEVRTVYTETVTDLVCSAIRREAEAAARLVGSDFLGVDIITTDPTVPLRTSGGVINEVNTTPALHHHYDATRERFPGVGVQALNALLRKKAAVAVPLRS
jgi:D-alanine-D-alanine ligase-like ATP-grasp enzyme